MNFLSNVTNFDFVENRRKAFMCSGALLVISLLSVIFHGGLNLGIDFAGGTVIQLKFQKSVDISKLRTAIKGIGIGDSVIQSIGSKENPQVLIKVEKLKKEMRKGVVTIVTDKIKASIANNPFEIIKAESVGPKVGRDMEERGFLAFISAICGILIYVSFRFEFKFGVGAIIALVHDVMITIGFISITNKEFTLSVLAALLTIAGYSVNDTIVVFDRIRENLRKHKNPVFNKIINISINETLSRTILTSLTTVIVTIILSLFGGSVIGDFAMCLTVGVMIGTFSSVFVATPIVMEWEEHRKKKEDARAAAPKAEKIVKKELPKAEKVTKEASKAKKTKETPKEKPSAKVEGSSKETTQNVTPKKKVQKKKKKGKKKKR